MILVIGRALVGLALFGIGCADLVWRLHSGGSIDAGALALDGGLISSGSAALGWHITSLTGGDTGGGSTGGA